MTIINIVSFLLFTCLIVFTFLIVNLGKNKQAFNPIKFMARVGIFGAISSILYVVPVFKFSLPFFPSFLELHFDEIPAFICGFAYGPIAALAVIVVKTLIKLPFTTTLCVGEFSDLVLSSVFVISSSIIYNKIRNLKGVFIAFAVSTFIQIGFAMIMNVYINIPFYESIMGFSEDSLLYLMRLAIPSINDVGWSYALFAVLPFNLLKDILVFIMTFLIYRKIHLFLRYDGRKGLKKN